jgi:hypothetical protein
MTQSIALTGAVVVLALLWQAYMFLRGHMSRATWSLTLIVIFAAICSQLPTVFGESPVSKFFDSLATLGGLVALTTFRLYAEEHNPYVKTVNARRATVVVEALAVALAVLTVMVVTRHQPLEYAPQPGMTVISMVYAVLARTCYAVILIGIAVWTLRRTTRRSTSSAWAPGQQPDGVVERVGLGCLGVGAATLGASIAIEALHIVGTAVGGPSLPLPTSANWTRVSAGGFILGIILPLVLGRGVFMFTWARAHREHRVLNPAWATGITLYPELERPHQPPRPRSASDTEARRWPKRTAATPNIVSRVEYQRAECWSTLTRLVHDNDPAATRAPELAQQLLVRLRSHRQLYRLLVEGGEIDIEDMTPSMVRAETRLLVKYSRSLRSTLRKHHIKVKEVGQYGHDRRRRKGIAWSGRAGNRQRRATDP